MATKMVRVGEKTFERFKTVCAALDVPIGASATEALDDWITAHWQAASDEIKAWFELEGSGPSQSV